MIEAYGYPDCIELTNADTRVVLAPACGGRVLEYARGGTNALYVNPAQNGYFAAPGKKSIEPCGGRCDIGPEMVTPPRESWLGRWTADITGPRQARLTSARDPVCGVQLARDFALAPTGTHLRFTQTIRNISTATRDFCHWGRTFAPNGGIALVPLTDPSRFPKKIVTYCGSAIEFQPNDPAIREREGFLEIFGATKQCKLGFDSTAGWLAYLMQPKLLFVKRFPVYPDRVYNEIAAITVCIFNSFNPDLPVCELEPIGPRERLAPGAAASFTEDWWLLEYPFPGTGEAVNLQQLRETVDRLAQP